MSSKSDFKPTFDQNFSFFSQKLRKRFRKTKQVSAHCPFHDDTNMSFSINMDDGVFRCHGCQLSGGLFDFEKYHRQQNGGSMEPDDIWREVYAAVGLEYRKEAQSRVVAEYNYTDAAGVLLYQKRRLEPKDFRQRAPDSKGGWRNSLDGVKKVLYNLPKIIVSRTVIVVEGEKDADNLNAALEVAGLTETVATTNFDGAGKWREEYAAYLAGRAVYVLPDNDDAGEAHAEAVAASVLPYAAIVKVLKLPGLPLKGDVSDWLAAGHPVTELVMLLRKQELWRPEPIKGDRHVLLEEVGDFLGRTPAQVEWLVEGIVPKGANGLIVASPKAGKSLLAIDLALALVSGSKFLDCNVAEKRRVALISREDSPDETGRRIKSFQRGRPDRADYTYGQLWLNTRHQSHEFLLDNGEQVTQLIAELKLESIDFAIFDVFRRLHNGDENDNSEMAEVLASLTRIQSATGAAIALVHHLTKETKEGSLFRQTRGAGAIHGWMEWGIGITTPNESEERSKWVRRAEFELKCAMPPNPIFYKIQSEEEAALLLSVTEDPEKSKDRKPSLSEVGPSTWHNKYEH